MQQIFNIIGLIPGYLIVLAILLVIIPTIVAILLRYVLYQHLKHLATKTKRLLGGMTLESTPKIIHKLEQRFVDSKVNLDQINTAAVIEGAYSQEKFYFLGLSLNCSFIDSFCRILPNLLLSFGLLGTFLGITFNLSNLSQTITQVDINDVNNLVEELNQPLQGMGVAFTTSLIAIACSSLLTVLNLIWNTNIVKAGLLNYLEDYIDNIYLPLVQPVSSVEGAIDKFSNDFEGMLHQLSNAIEESMTRAFSRIESSANIFEKAANVLDTSAFPERLAAATNDLAIAQNQFSQSSLVLQKSTQSFDHNLIAIQKLTKKVLELNQEQNAIDKSSLKEIQQELSKLVNKIN